MKVIITAVVMALALMSGTTPGFAGQDETHKGDRDGMHRSMRGDGPRDPARMVERMSRHLDLDELQQEKLNNILLTRKPEQEALRDRDRANREALSALDENDPQYSTNLSDLAAEKGQIVAERTVLMGKTRSDINTILTEEQRTKLGDWSKHRRHQKGRRAPAGDSEVESR